MALLVLKTLAMRQSLKCLKSYSVAPKSFSHVPRFLLSILTVMN